MTVRSRHDTILRHLRRRGTATIDDIAREVNVSRRTVLRDIAALRDQGFVIYSECGRGGGLQLDPQSVQMTTRLSVSEVFALLISVASMRAAEVLPFSDLADAGLAKIERSLSQEKVRDLRRMLDCLYIGTLSPQQDISDIGAMDADLLPTFESAFLQKRYLTFWYRDVRGIHTEREVEPQAMLILPPLWYLVAWDPARDDFRHFRMDRIKQPQIVNCRKFLQKHIPFEKDVCPFADLKRRYPV